MNRQLPVTAIIATSNRAEVLKRTLCSLAEQSCQPVDIIIIDASENSDSEKLCSVPIDGLRSAVTYKKARIKGAASQRNEGIEIVVTPFILFLDDDIELHPGCVENLWNCLMSQADIGAVNAMIINQQYHSPGRLTRFMYQLMSGEKLSSYAGKCIGPAWNLLPEDRPELPDWREVEWLNTTCTIYRREALPIPVFPGHFKGYSLMEDLSLSLQVAKRWKLYNVRTARIYHDSQPGTHKNSVYAVSKMELINRYYVMVKVLGRKGLLYHIKLAVFELFNIVVVLTSISGWRNLLPSVAGKFSAVFSIMFNKSQFL